MTDGTLLLSNVYVAGKSKNAPFARAVGALASGGFHLPADSTLYRLVP